MLLIPLHVIVLVLQVLIVTELWLVATSLPINDTEWSFYQTEEENRPADTGITDSIPFTRTFALTEADRSLLDHSATSDGGATRSKSPTSQFTTANAEEFVSGQIQTTSSERSSKTKETTGNEDNIDIATWFSTFSQQFETGGKRAILFGIVERDANGSSSSKITHEDFPIKTWQQLDQSRLSFSASAGDAIATLVIDSNVKNKRNEETLKPVTVHDMMTNLHRTKRTTEEGLRRKAETFYIIREYQHPMNEEITLLDFSSTYTTRPTVDMPFDEYRSYLESSYGDDEKCKPESVNLYGNGHYLPDVVPGVRCNARCSACDDGYAYKAVMYPMPALKSHRIGDTQTYYVSTRSIPVYCACFRGPTTESNVAASYTREDASNFYEAFDSVDDDDVYRAFDSTSAEDVSGSYNVDEADDAYDGFEPLPS